MEKLFDSALTTQRQLEILDRLAEAGLQIARSIEQRGKTVKSRKELDDLKKSYDIVVREVLQTLHMRAKLAAGDIPTTIDAPLEEIVETMAGILRPPASRSVN